MRLWVTSVDTELTAVPRPTDIPQVHAPGTDSDRILVVGSGAAVGWGVLSHDLSLPGALARAVSARTGRGAVVDVIPDPAMTAETALGFLEDAKLWRYDAVVVMIGINDAIGLTSPSVWRHHIAALYKYIEDASSLSTSVFAVGIPPIRALRVYDAFIGGIAERHGSALNKCTQLVVEQLNRTTYVPFSPVAVPVPNRYRSPEEYRAWADLLVDAIAEPLNTDRVQLDETPSNASLAEDAAHRERERQRAVDDLGIAGSPPEERFDRIVELARRTFNTRVALFSVIDHERQWNKARSGLEVEEFPREGSACTVTIQESGPFVIPDTQADSRFSAHPFVTGEPHIRFYAGFPVEAPSGERIGALCVMDDEPRERAEVDEVLLREFAMLVQAELWKGR
jgi:hypothetical protein